MALTTPAYLFCTETDIVDLLSELGLQALLDDDQSGTVETAEESPQTKAINYASQRVLMYLQPRYESADIATSWLVNSWATIIAVHWLCGRRGNPVPKTVQALMFGSGQGDDRGCIGELKDIQKGNVVLPDVGQRHPEEIGHSNVVVDPRYHTKQVRVQRQTSDQSPRQVPVTVDWTSENVREI